MMHRMGAAVGVLALGLTLAACDTSEDDTSNDDDAPVEAEGSNSNNQDDVEEQDADTVDEPAEEAESHGEATWMGEELSLEWVSCGTGRPEPDIRQIRAGGEDFDLTVQLVFDRDASDEDNVVLASDDVGVEIFFHGEGGTIGDGEGYQGSTAFGAEADGDADAVSGSLHLDPDSVSRADEVNPGGGQVTFALTC